MINHVRTLILNATDSTEFIPPDFVPMPDTPLAARIRQCLFRGLTARQRDGRMHQIMQLLHTADLEGLTLADDRRVTYLPFRQCQPDMHPGSLIPIVQQLHASITPEDEDVLFGDAPELLDLWRSDKMLFDFAGIMLALARHIHRSR